MSEHRHDENCRELAARLSEYLDGELAEDLVRDVDEHFHACQRCEEFVESLERVRRLGALLPAPAPAPERRKALVEALRSKITSGAPGSDGVPDDPGASEEPP